MQKYPIHSAALQSLNNHIGRLFFRNQLTLDDSGIHQAQTETESFSERETGFSRLDWSLWSPDSKFWDVLVEGQLLLLKQLFEK